MYKAGNVYHAGRLLATLGEINLEKTEVGWINFVDSFAAREGIPDAMEHKILSKNRIAD